MKRVLIVDDSELIIAQLGDLLVTLGYEVVGSASSGTEAVGRAKRLHPDIVLMDIVMPGEMDGIEAGRRIRADLDIPVILLTGYEDEGSIDRIKEARAYGFIMKPVRSLELKASIEIALQEKESESRFRDLYREVVENTSDLIYVVDGRGNIKYANEQIVKLGGYTKEEAIGKNFASFLTPDSLAYSAEIFRRHRGGDEVGPFELEVFDRAGEIHVIEMGERLVWGKGRVVEVHGIGRDVTERKRAEKELKRSEEKYRKIFNNAIEGIYQTNPEGRFISANPAFARILGYESPEELVAAVTDIGGQVYVNSGDRRIMKELLETNGVVEDFETQFRRKNGEEIWVSFTASIIRGEDGDAVSYEGILVDITEKRRAREEILYLKEFNENIINNMIDLIDIVDKDYTIVFQNKASKKKYGRGVGRKCYELYHHRDIPCDYCTAADAIAEKKCLSRDVLLDNGTYLEVHSSPIKMPDGTYCSMEIMRDITERKRAEEALKESEAKFRSVFETSRDFMYISSLDGKIIDYNLSGKEFFGYSDQEIISMTMLDLYHDPEEREKIIEKLKAEGFIQSYEVKLKKKDGSLFDALATIAVRKDSNGNIVGFQGTVKDITQMRQMERQLQQVEKLSGLGTMISGIAHELNNPLTAIMGNAELLSMNKSVTDREKKSLDVILQESSRAAKIVSGLLAFAREHRPERRVISVNDVVMESLTLREYNLRVNNISVQLSLSSDVLPTLGDPYQLQQVFTNIINNASDALTETGGGKLTIRTEQKEEMLRIVFEDDGPGIETENLKKVFDPFFTTKDIGKGTGLGLSMAYGIIEEHGGKIKVESEPGRGATFTVKLPVHKGKGEGSKKETEYVAKTFPGKSVLIVDDEAVVRDFLSDLLLKEGYSVQAAPTAEDALSLMKDTSFDAVVADIRMPGMDGKELYAHILKNYPAVSKKMLFITGDTLNEETQVFLRTSNTNAITKPFKIDEFLAGLNRIFEE
jgi:PAS domain S-box-containing protein